MTIVPLNFDFSGSVPETPVGEMTSVIVVTRSKRGQFCFAGYYLNRYPLEFEEPPEGAEESGDDGHPTTGWYYENSNFDYESCYFPVSGEVVAWALMPKAAEVINAHASNPPPQTNSRVLQKLPAAFEVLDTESGTYLTRSEDRARNSGFEYNGLYRRDSAEPEVTPHSDDLAVDRFAAAMKAKLAKKRDEGKSGWEDKDECSQLFLSQLLREHVEKGDPVDVGNLAMMLHQREEQIASLLETLQGE